jgi:glycosyltransferase involved in cell wall biosynthesis
MKILLATPLYPPDHGGPATDAASLEKTLPSYGIDTIVYSFGNVRHLPTVIRHIHYAFNLIKKAKDVDCIVSMDTFSVCIPSAFVAKLLHKKFIVRVPGDFVWEQSTQRFGITDSIEVFQTKHYSFKIECLRYLQKWAIRQADLAVVCSNFLKKIVLNWGVRSEQIVCIYLGMDITQHSIAPSFVPNGKIIFSLGRFVPWKGFEMIIDLIAELPNDWYFVLAGDGALRSTLQKKVDDLNLLQRVHFTGIIPYPEILGWYKRADVFILNSSQENFSFQVLEGMASGTPTIATTAGSIPELVRNGIDGILCEPNNKIAFKQALLSVVNEPERWKQRTESAKMRALDFSLEKSVHLFAHEIKKLCA